MAHCRKNIQLQIKAHYCQYLQSKASEMDVNALDMNGREKWLLFLFTSLNTVQLYIIVRSKSTLLVS